MFPENSDIAALSAQGDIHRFVVKVMGPALAEFRPSSDVTGEFNDIEEFLNAAEVNTHNALCYEIRCAFALILGALFERQLRVWLSTKLPNENIEKADWPNLLYLIKSVDPSIHTHPVMKELSELWLLSNAVRHGKGPSAEKLFREKPLFWNFGEPRSGVKGDVIGNMRIPELDLNRYATAVMVFWHLAGASSLPPSECRV
jgi:hypothetical protein